MSDKKSVTSLQHDATTLDHTSLQGVGEGRKEKSSYIALKVNLSYADTAKSMLVPLPHTKRVDFGLYNSGH
jgi:hypothetical protein